MAKKLIDKVIEDYRKQLGSVRKLIKAKQKEIDKAEKKLIACKVASEKKGQTTKERLEQEDAQEDLSRLEKEMESLRVREQDLRDKIDGNLTVKEESGASAEKEREMTYKEKEEAKRAKADAKEAKFEAQQKAYETGAADPFATRTSGPDMSGAPAAAGGGLFANKKMLLIVAAIGIAAFFMMQED